ncbi:MAG: IPT/TIG domain-containing protein [Acidobacteriota bacterium]
MKHGRQRLLFFLALAALLAIFAGCKGESPTAPPVTGTGGTGGAGNPPGGVTPPVGATLVLTVSNANPLIDSVSTITATVSLNGQPVVNGTAVEFVTNLGIFTDTQDVRTIRTTTNGVTTAVLTSPDAGVATVSATVNNVTRTVQVTFSETPIIPVPPSTAPTISSVTPNTGPPTGGTTININGTNFRTPVRVIVDAGPAGSKEAFVVSVTPTQIVAVTPSINLAATQTQAAAITVIVDAGSATEARVTRSAAFTYVTTNLTPIFRALSPTSGPIEGGTRVTILGDAFDAAGGVQVFFGSAQAQIIGINFNQIIVMSPTARDTAPNASGPVTGPVDLRIKNIASGKEVIAVAAFRYTPKMQITTVQPLIGTALGGTIVTIDGTGFNDPLAVFFGDVLAQVLKVTGTQIQARTGALASPCTSASGGAITVMNTDNGDTAIAPPLFAFQYVGVAPTITGVTVNSPPAVPGGSLQVSVLNPGVGPLGTANVRFTIGASTAFALPNPILVGTGTTVFTVNIPTNVTFPTIACLNTGVAGTQLGPVTFPITFNNLTTTCTDTLTDAVTVFPSGANPCITPPVAAVTSPVPPACANAGSVVAAGAATGNATITIANNAPATGGGTLRITGVTVSGANASEFTVAPPPTVTVAAGASTNFTVTFDPAAVGARTASVTFTTNDPNNPTLTVCLTGAGT